jgi:hypothetical protein
VCATYRAPPPGTSLATIFEFTLSNGEQGTNLTEAEIHDVTNGKSWSGSTDTDEQGGVASYGVFTYNPEKYDVPSFFLS